MNISDQRFTAKVELPCKMFREVESNWELTGIVVSIDTRSLLLRLRDASASERLGIGESMRLELELPVASQVVKPKYLSVRAKVATVTDQQDGSLMVEFRFRKASFKDSVERGLPKIVKARGAGWRM